MILKCYLLRDIMSLDYGKPILFENDKLAFRYLSTLISSQSLEKFKRQIFLKFIGVFNSKDGSLVISDKPYAIDSDNNYIDDLSILNYQGEENNE